ncbi:hypothetical protein CVT24_009928 [Panaeolus cyanescens]|uniref:DUF1308 domain-containing protein n=1 Tax=Panaeolus cyanescens TaxID=181874 RepID=A0A409W435_9AGAR|nr:hypothetical protein CVT24_009928 [Panaeolus cyanescens]
MAIPESHLDLVNLRVRLQTISEVITQFQPLTPRPPIIDSSYEALGVTVNDTNKEGEINEKGTSWLHPEPIPGLRKLKEDIGIDLGVLEKFLDQPNSETLPPLSTNAPYVIAVWNEVLCAPQPVVDIFKTFLETPAGNAAEETAHIAKAKRVTGGKRHPPAAKVDVVADGGRRWIRVNTIKNSRLLSEFCEIDSYLADTDSEPEDELDQPAPTQLDNSVIRMARSLLTAAHANPVLVNGVQYTPNVTLRLTRLDPTALTSRGQPVDKRIGETIKLLEQLGVTVELGERSPTVIHDLEEKSMRTAQMRPTSQSSFSSGDFVPTININLDLSVLIALISDLTHAALPTTIEEANGRFVPPPEYREWKAKQRQMGGMSGKKTRRITDETISTPSPGESTPSPPPWSTLTAEALETDINDLPRDLFKHARSLTNQLLQEMGKGMLQELYDRIEAGIQDEAQRNGGLRPRVVFWTTREARDRCLGIVAKIGGVYERRRAKGLFQVSSLAEVSKAGWDQRCEKMDVDEAEKLYWLGSRFEKGFVPLLPMRIYEDDVVVDGPDGGTQPVDSETRSPFSRVLQKVCVDMLSEGPVPHPRSLPDNVVSTPPLASAAEANLGPSTVLPLDGFNPDVQIQRAKVTKANPRLTAHTVESMLRGAERGWTTLTANRTSVKTILKEVRAVGWQDNIDPDETEGGDGTASGKDVDAKLKAAIWVVDPRSLAEGMSIFATRN